MQGQDHCITDEALRFMERFPEVNSSPQASGGGTG